jgi:glycosyltransferase involved in cell wall biosynthesis
MKSLMWIGDAACSSGFGRASDQILKVLSKQWEVSVIGINYNGDPRDDYSYKIYPAWSGRDPLGIGRLPELLDKIKPEAIVVQTNPWHVPVYRKALHLNGYGCTPVVGIIAVEGKNCRGEQLNGLKRAILWTEFGRDEATKGGMRVPSDVIPLGVDTEVFKPGDQVAARRFLGLPGVPEDSFIVLNVNRNQSRKRLDLTIMFFAEWIQSKGIRDAYLYLHVLPGSSVAIDCDQLGFYCGISDRLILAAPRDTYRGAPEAYVVAANQASDAYLTTSLGEGFGLTAIEAMACGKPVIAGRYAALAEWAAPAALLVDCNSEGVMPDVNGMIGSAPAKEAVVQALDLVYTDKITRGFLGAQGLKLARDPKFNWTNISNRFAVSIQEALL